MTISYCLNIIWSFRLGLHISVQSTLSSQTYYKEGVDVTPILRIGDQVPTFDVFWPKHFLEVRSTVNIHAQSMLQM